MIFVNSVWFSKYTYHLVSSHAYFDLCKQLFFVMVVLTLCYK
jgi:hypothetical protein